MDFNKPIQGSLLNNQYFMKSKMFFFRDSGACRVFPHTQIHSSYTRWWFQLFFIFTTIFGEDFPFDSYFFRWVGSTETTHQCLLCEVFVPCVRMGWFPAIGFCGDFSVGRLNMRIRVAGSRVGSQVSRPLGPRPRYCVLVARGHFFQMASASHTKKQ